MDTLQKLVFSLKNSGQQGYLLLRTVRCMKVPPQVSEAFLDCIQLLVGINEAREKVLDL